MQRRNRQGGSGTHDGVTGLTVIGHYTATRHALSLFVMLFFVACGNASAARNPEPDQNGHTAHCQNPAHWRALFDGQSLNNWELVRSGPAGWLGWLKFWQRGDYGGWRIDNDGLLTRQTTQGDLRTRQQFANFELRLAWRISSGGNSGIKLRVADVDGGPANTGFEMQILDNKGHKDGSNPLTAAGALYGLYPAPTTASTVRPPGEWNDVHIFLQDQTVRFHLNEIETVTATIDSVDWLQRLEHAPQRDRLHSSFARHAQGHILLQDHFDDVWFRNISICELPKKLTTTPTREE